MVDGIRREVSSLSTLCLISLSSSSFLILSYQFVDARPASQHRPFLALLPSNTPPSHSRQKMSDLKKEDKDHASVFVSGLNSDAGDRSSSDDEKRPYGDDNQPHIGARGVSRGRLPQFKPLETRADCFLIFAHLQGDVHKAAFESGPSSSISCVFGASMSNLERSS